MRFTIYPKEQEGSAVSCSMDELESPHSHSCSTTVLLQSDIVDMYLPAHPTQESSSELAQDIIQTKYDPDYICLPEYNHRGIEPLEGAHPHGKNMWWSCASKT